MKQSRYIISSILLLTQINCLLADSIEQPIAEQQAEQSAERLAESDNQVTTRFTQASIPNTVVFHNILIEANEFVKGTLTIGGSVAIGGSTVINGDLVVDGQITAGGSNFVVGPISSTINAVARYADSTGKVIKDSSVLVDDTGNIEIDGITKNGNTVSWPSIVGAANTFLASDGAGNLIYATPAGGGNVNTAAPFSADNRIIRTDFPSGSTNIQESGITLDDSNNINGINALTANTLNANTLSATTLTGNLTGNVTGNVNGNVTGNLTGNVTGNVTGSLFGNATTATTATNFTGSLSGDVTGTQSATVVNSVGGQSAANVAAATVATNAATASNTPNTIVKRDGSGNFAASTITANLIGAASLNVLKAGDTMTGNLALATQSATQYQDSTNTGFVGLRAPTSVPASYTIDLPGTAPIAGQFLQATSASATQWANTSGAPTATKTYYVALNGSDSNDGSFNLPFRTVSHAVSVANGVSSLVNPVSIQVGAGIFIEDNSGGPIAITASGISIVGSATLTTIIKPSTASNTLFSSTTVSIQFSDLTLSGSPSSTASGISLSTNTAGGGGFTRISVNQFQTGFNMSSSAGVPLLIFESVQCAGNTTSIALSNIRAIVRNSVFGGPVSGSTPSNTAISITGSTALVAVLSSIFNTMQTAITASGGSTLRVTGSNIVLSTNGIVVSGASKGNITGSDFANNNASSININASGSGTTVAVTGCNFQCADTTGAVQGKAIQCTTDASIGIDSCAIDSAVTAITCGTTGDTSSTSVLADSVALTNCTNDVIQVGTSTLHFLGGVFAANKISIADPTNVSFAAFDKAMLPADLSIGNTTDTRQIMYQVQTNVGSTPTLTYEPNYYGAKGTIYENPTTDPTCNGTQATSNDATYFVVTQDRTKQAGISLISDTGNVGSPDNVRGWTINKLGTSASLSCNYSNNDTSGQAARGSNAVMVLNGFDNQVEFPTATNTPLPTNTVAKLVWAGDTNLYRLSAGTLQTDGNLNVAGLTASRALTSNSSSQLTASTTTDTELGFLSGTTSSVQTQINGKVAKSGDTMTGSLQLPAGTTSAPSLNFTASPTTGFSAATADTLSMSTAGSERLKISSTGIVTIDGLNSAAVVHTDGSGNLSTSQIVNADVSATAAIVDTKLATISTAGKVSNSATTATSANTANAIVARDASGNFAAGTITANLTGNVSGSATTATNFTGSLLGDVTGTQSATVVSLVGGQTATNVASATVAANAATSTNTPSTIVARDASGNFAAGTITANLTGNVTGNLSGNATSATTATTATNFSGALVGDVIGTQSATVVSLVGGQTATNVAAATVLANAATAANTASAIVRRDSSGNFSAGTITANLTGNVTGNVTGNLTGNATTATSATTATNATNFTGSLSGDVTGTQSATVVSLVGGQTASNVALATIAANNATSTNTPSTIVKRDSSGNFASNMISLSGTVTNPTDVTTKSYVDNAVASGFTVHTPARVVATTNVALTGLQTIDGVTLVNNDRVLLVGQTSSVENGLWVSHSGAWTRPTDFAAGNQAGTAYVLIQSGTLNAGTSWVCATPTAIIDTDPISFAQFSLAEQTTAANVGGQVGQIFRDKIGNTLNLKTLGSSDAHLVITNNTDDILLATDATSSNSPSTIVARDGSGNFSAGTITASLIGAASLNVLKAGDTMTGNLAMATQSATRFQDSTNTGFVGLRAPTSVPSSYTVDLPSAAPTAGQFLQATSASATQWAAVGGAPSTSKTYYVALNGNDSNDGSFSAPFRTISHAVSVANGVASFSNPVVIQIGAGIFVENNSGGPITITANGINILGSSISSTIVIPQDLTVDLFRCTTPNVLFSQFSIQAGGVGSTANGISIISSTPGIGRFEALDIRQFQAGINISATTAAELAFENIQALANGTAITINNASAALKNSIIVGSLTGSPVNTGISVTGSSAGMAIQSVIFGTMDTCASIDGGANVNFISGSFGSCNSSVVVSGNSMASIVGYKFANNFTNTVNIQASGAGTTVSITGCDFQCATAGVLQGTAIQCTTAATIKIDSCSIDGAVTAIACGTTGDTSSTSISANSVSISNCTNDVVQVGTSMLHFLGGIFAINKISIADPTNVSFAAFDISTQADLSIGNATDTQQVIYQVQNATSAVPELIYEPNYYGFKGTIFENPTSNATCNGTQATSNDAAYFVVTQDRTKQAGISLISDTGNVGSPDNVRGWTINKLGTSASLSCNYSNNDTSGQAARGSNAVMVLNGFDNQVEFPTASNSPLPTNTVAKLVWAGDTNLYRSSAGTLQTDGNLIVAGLTANRALTSNSSKQLTSSVTTDTELGFLSGTTSSVQTQLNGKVAKSGDTMTGALQLPAGTTSAPSLNFTGSPTSGFSAATADTLSMSTAGSERMKISSTGIVTIDGLNSAAVVHTDASGNLSTSQIVNADVSATAAIVDTKLATISTAGKVANSATTATSANTASAIVARDASGNFSAGTITATLSGSATSATNFTGSLSGDVTGTQSATVVSSVGGQTAANVASATIAANAATSTNTASTIVKRDTSGNFAAGTITADLTGNVTGNLSGNATSATTATTATNFTGSLSGDVTGTQSATVVSAVGGQTAANVAAATVLANAATANNTASAIVRRDGSGNFSAGTITASLTGAASLNVLKTGDTMTGALQLPAGTTSAPALKFTGSTTTGFSAATADTLSMSTAGSERMKISSTGTVSINGLNSAAVVHTDGSGNLSTSQIVNADVSATAAIVDTKLATISTAGKVSNSATTATSANTASAIVARDASGNFSAGTITASLTGAASLNVLKAGDTMTGTLVHPAGTAASPSIQFTGSTNTGISASTSNTLSFDTNGVEQMNIDTSINTIAALVVKNIYANQATQTFTVTANNQTVTVNSGISLLILNFSANRTGLTVNFPPSPIDGQIFTIMLSTTNTITFTALNGGTGGATVVGALTGLASGNNFSATANGNSVTYLYVSSLNSWFRYARG